MINLPTLTDPTGDKEETAYQHGQQYVREGRLALCPGNPKILPERVLVQRVSSFLGPLPRRMRREGDDSRVLMSMFLSKAGSESYRGRTTFPTH